MKFIDTKSINEALDYPSLINALKEAFISDIKVPPRHHHDFKNPKEGMDSTLLLMPAWEESESIGVKIVTVSPNNAKYDLPGIQGLYLLMDAQKGSIEALIEGKSFLLTVIKDKENQENRFRRINVRKIVSLDEAIELNYNNVEIQVRNTNDLEKLYLKSNWPKKAKYIITSYAHYYEELFKFYVSDQISKNKNNTLVNITTRRDAVKSLLIDRRF